MHNRDYIRMPPDGAGKGVSVGHIVYVSYIAGNQGNVLPGAVALGLQSNVQGIVAKHVSKTITSGDIVILLDDEHEDEDFIIGEQIEIVNANGNFTGTITEQNSLFVNKSQIVSADNPFYGQHVDNQGAANVRFAEGRVQFDAFGGLQTTEYKSVGSYVPSYSGLEYSFSDIIEGGASGTFDPNTGSYVMQCGTSASDSIIRRSNKNHQYHPGVSQYIRMTVACGDSGKDNVVRRWGYFDDNDGVYFELDSSELSVVLRKNLGGGVEEQRVPQSLWNVDKLDGTGLSQMTINPSKNNIWWMDLAFLGGGRVRMGVFGPDGSRIVAHVFENTNVNNYAYMRTATLPVGFEQFNTGLVGSTSSLNVNLAVVGQESQATPIHNFFGKDFPSKTVTGSDYIHYGSIRSEDTHKGLLNKVLVLANDMDFSAVDSTTGEAKPIRVAVAFNANITAPVWEPHGDAESSVEFSTNSVDVLQSAARVVYVAIIHPGQTLDLSNIFPYEGNAFITRWHNGMRPHGSVFVKPVNPADEVVINGDFTWREYP